MKKQNIATEKLTDKAFSRLVLTSVLGILVCIVCLCSTTYAWFADNAPSNGNSIKTANSCELIVTLTDSSGTAIEITENGVELESGVYTVTLSLPPNTASGYCVITAGTDTIYTDYITRHTESEPQTVTYSLIVTTAQTVKFTPRWGIYTQQVSAASNGGIILIKND